MTPPETSEDGWEPVVRWGLTAMLWCAGVGAAAVEAWYRIVTAWELRAYWAGSQGALPFRAVAWSVRRFGHNPMALRLPLLMVFALVLAAVLWIAMRALRRVGTAKIAVGVIVVLAVGAGVEFHSLIKVRVERYALHAAMGCVERAAAPGELVAVDDPELAMRMEWYAPDWLREQLRVTVMESSIGYPRILALAIDRQSEEFVLVGVPDARFARVARARGFVLRGDDCGEDSGRKFEVLGARAGTGVLFVMGGGGAGR